MEEYKVQVDITLTKIVRICARDRMTALNDAELMALSNVDMNDVDDYNTESHICQN